MNFYNLWHPCLMRFKIYPHYGSVRTEDSRWNILFKAPCLTRVKSPHPISVLPAIKTALWHWPSLSHWIKIHAFFSLGFYLNHFLFHSVLHLPEFKIDIAFKASIDYVVPLIIMPLHHIINYNNHRTVIHEVKSRENR